MTFLVDVLSFFFLDYRFTLVNTAIHTYMVRKDGFMTLRAQWDVGQIYVMMGSSHIPSWSWCFLFWYRHNIRSSLLVIKSLRDFMWRGFAALKKIIPIQSSYWLLKSKFWSVDKHEHVEMFKLRPHRRQSPLHSGMQSVFMGTRRMSCSLIIWSESKRLPSIKSRFRSSSRSSTSPSPLNRDRDKDILNSADRSQPYCSRHLSHRNSNLVEINPSTTSFLPAGYILIEVERGRSSPTIRSSPESGFHHPTGSVRCSFLPSGGIFVKSIFIEAWTDSRNDPHCRW